MTDSKLYCYLFAKKMLPSVLVELVAITLAAVICSLGEAAAARGNDALVRVTTPARRLWKPSAERSKEITRFKLLTGCIEGCKQMTGAYALGRANLDERWNEQWSEQLPCNRAKPENTGFRDKLGLYQTTLR